MDGGEVEITSLNSHFRLLGLRHKMLVNVKDRIITKTTLIHARIDF